MRVNVTRLSSGLTVVTERMPHLESVALGVWIKSGSRNETTAEHGIAHLLEHMAFKGTARRTARQIAEEIENVGGEVNAATSTETTSYYARVLKDHVPLAVDILADILTESLFDEDELEREKNVILEEIGAATDTPDDVIFDNFSGVAYRDQTIGRPILGTPETVQSFTSAQIRHYLARNYTTDRIFVVAAGAVDHQSFVKQVEERFASLPQLPVTTPVLEKAIYTGGEIRETRDLMDAQVLLGFEGKAYHARDFYCSQILANILGGGMSSRLFQKCESPAAFVIPFMPSIGVFRHRHFRRACGDRRQRPPGTDARHRRRVAQVFPDHSSGRNRPRPRTNPRATADGSGKPGSPCRPDGTADDALRPTHPQ